MKLWVFGHSGCLPFGLEHGVAWPEQLALSLEITCENFAQSGADNLFIYHCFKKNLKHIKPDDIVIVGWSHPNRKSFVLNQTNTSHRLAVSNGCMIFDSDPKFFRSKGMAARDTKEKWAAMIPSKQGNSFFDTWFQDYHSEYECRLNLQAYQDSVQQCVPCKHLCFYFSRESVDHPQDNEFYWLDFILENRLWISDIDMHPSQEGHNEMAKIFLQLLDT